jgi:hypothetical protein
MNEHHDRKGIVPALQLVKRSTHGAPFRVRDDPYKKQWVAGAVY